MTNWNQILKESKMATGVVRTRSVPTFSITKAGTLSMSGAVRNDILSRRQDITHVRPRYHEGENIILLEFLTDGSERGARKISNMHAKTGTGSAGFRSFLKQMGLKLQDVIGRYDAETVDDLDGEWWMFKLK